MAQCRDLARRAARRRRLVRVRPTWPELTDLEAIEAAVVWRPPVGMLEQWSNLRVICAMGAGIDSLFGPDATPPNLPVVRLIDPVMSERMASYVLPRCCITSVSSTRYREQQCQRVWRQMMHSDTADVRIGIRGLGPMGRASAELLERDIDACCDFGRDGRFSSR